MTTKVDEQDIRPGDWVRYLKATGAYEIAVVQYVRQRSDRDWPNLLTDCGVIEADCILEVRRAEQG